MNMFQIYLTDNDTTELPPVIAGRVKTVKNLFANCDYRMYTNSTLRKFIEDNYPKDVLDAYDSLIPYSYKADLGRYCLLNKLGGWYVDIALHSNLRQIYISGIENADMLVFTIPLYRKFTGVFWSIINGCLYSKPNNPILSKMIQKIVDNCKSKFYGRNQLDPTGPNLFGQIITEFAPSMNIIYGSHEELTPTHRQTNEALVLPDGTIFMMCKNGRGADLTSLGATGVNNYADLWRDRKSIPNLIRFKIDFKDFPGTIKALQCLPPP